MLKLRTVLLTLALASTSMAMMSIGCTAEVAPEGATDAAESLLLAEVKLSSGSRYEFISVGDGDMMILASHPSIEVASAALRRERGESIAAFYERLTGAAAPLSLVDAERTARALGAELAEPEIEVFDGMNAASPGEGLAGSEDVGVARSALTWSEFDNQYCSNWGDYLFCFPSTGNAWCESRGLTMEGAVHAKGGGVTVRLRYKTITGWHTYEQRYVAKGEVVTMANAYFLARRLRRFEVLNNDVDKDLLYFMCTGTN